MRPTPNGGFFNMMRDFEYTKVDFERIQKLIHLHAGIFLSKYKSEMVYGRVGRHMRSIGIRSFKQYLDQLENSNDCSQWEDFINCLTTNLTSFFREEHHFPVLGMHLLKQNRPITIWCSAASTGEEPYSIAMAACEAFKTLKPPVKIIATDIDTNVLASARSATYATDRIAHLSATRREQFFLRGTGDRTGSVKVKHELTDLISFEKVNLIDRTWNFQTPFDAIFCRNVMIYFDQPTQAEILNKFTRLMHAETLLFFGHAENFLHASKTFKPHGRMVYTLQTDQTS